MFSKAFSIVLVSGTFVGVASGEDAKAGWPPGWIPQSEAPHPPCPWKGRSIPQLGRFKGGISRE